MEKKRLYRDAERKKLLGVCSGLANYLDVDVTIVRLIWVLMFFCAGVGVVAYLICALIMPVKY